MLSASCLARDTRADHWCAQHTGHVASRLLTLLTVTGISHNALYLTLATTQHQRKQHKLDFTSYFRD